MGCQSSYHITIPRFQLGALMLTPSIPCPSSAPIPFLHFLCPLVLQRVLPLPFGWRQLSCLTHLGRPNVFHDGALPVSSLLLLIPPYYIWKDTHLMRQISPPTIKLEIPNTLYPSLLCYYGAHECPQPNQPNSPAPKFELEAVTWRIRNHTEPIVKGVAGKPLYLVSSGSIQNLASVPAAKMGRLHGASCSMSFQGLLQAHSLKLILVSQRFSEPANVT